jgi:hypothetical protein
MDYKTKYLKYKTKYLKLKSQNGGTPTNYTYEYMDDLYNFVANLGIFKDMHVICFNTSSLKIENEIYYTVRLICIISKYNNSEDDKIYNLCNDKTQYTISDFIKKYFYPDYNDEGYVFNNNKLTTADYLNITCDLEKNEIKKPIPGNSKKCINDIPKGTNFMWGNWNSMGKIVRDNGKRVIHDITIIIKKNIITKEFAHVIMSTFNNSNLSIQQNERRFSSLINTIMWDFNISKLDDKIKKIYNDKYFIIVDSDIRITKLLYITYNDKPKQLDYNKYNIIYNAELKKIFIFEKTRQENEIHIKEMLTIENEDGKNFTPIVNLFGDLIFLNKFDNIGLCINKHNIQTQKKSYIYIKYKNPKKTIHFKGSCEHKIIDEKSAINNDDKNYMITPAFSFGTPVVYKNGKIYGVGHIKIHNNEKDYIYKKDSNIDIFRKNISENMKKISDKKYIPHYGTYSFVRPEECQGFIYMMYFYCFEKDCFFMNNTNNTYDVTFKISNAYLPINPQKENLFSLVFPIGAYDNDNNEMVITCGEGDFYNTEMKISFDEIDKLCIHDISDIDMNIYKYQYIINNNQIADDIPS